MRKMLKISKKKGTTKEAVPHNAFALSWHKVTQLTFYPLALYMPPGRRAMMPLIILQALIVCKGMAWPMSHDHAIRHIHSSTT